MKAEGSHVLVYLSAWSSYLSQLLLTVPTGNMLHKPSPKKILTKIEAWAEETAQSVKYFSRHGDLHWIRPRTLTGKPGKVESQRWG